MEVRIEKTKENNPKIRSNLVDVPVEIFLWSRPQLQKKQFEILHEARPSILFFVSDGGRNEEEKQLIEESRKIVNNIDWDCTVYRIYWTENQGMYSVSRQADNYIWEIVDRLIVLEDDIIPSVSFFSFCAELLEKYKNDLRIAAICGMNHLGIYDSPDKDYFFSRIGGIWGYACWKRTHDTFGNFSFKYDPYVIREVCNIARKDTYFCKAMKKYAVQEKFSGHIAGPEFFFVLDIFAQNQLFIIPKKNMISCWGCGSGATHATDSIKKLAKGDAQFFFMETYELKGKLNHPEYVFPDETYESRQKRVTAWHHPVISTYRRIVGICKRIYYGDGKQMIKKFLKRITNRKEYFEEK